jgi:hypothetical protein
MQNESLTGATLGGECPPRPRVQAQGPGGRGDGAGGESRSPGLPQTGGARGQCTRLLRPRPQQPAAEQGRRAEVRVVRGRRGRVPAVRGARLLCAALPRALRRRRFRPEPRRGEEAAARGGGGGPVWRTASFVWLGWVVCA